MNIFNKKKKDWYLRLGKEDHRWGIVDTFASFGGLAQSHQKSYWHSWGDDVASQTILYQSSIIDHSILP
jgi:hypothetical protein